MCAGAPAPQTSEGGLGMTRLWLLLVFSIAVGTAAFADDTNASAVMVAPMGDSAAFGKFSSPVTVHIGMQVDPTDKTLPAGDSSSNNEYTRYLKDKYNINVVVDWTAAQGNNYNQKVSLTIASGNLPDGMIAPDRTYMFKAASSDLLYNISTLFKQYSSKQVLDIMDSTNGVALTNASYNGKMVSLPNITTTADGVIVMWLRKDWLDKLHLAVPRTVSDIEKVARAFVQNKMAGPNTIGIAGPSKNSNLYCDFLQSSNVIAGFDPVFAAFDAYPGYWVDTSGKVAYGTISPNTKKAISTLAKWYAEGIIDPEMGTRDNVSDPINANQAGIFFAPWWAGGYGNPDSFKNDPTANWKAFPVYTDDGKWNVHMKTTGTTYTLVGKNASTDAAKAVIIMNNALVRDEQTFDVSVAIGWYPLRNVMAPSDEMEYTYREVMKVLKGQAQPDDYNKPGSVYKNLYTDVKKARSIVNPPFDNINISNYNQKADFGEFQRLFSALVGDNPYTNVPISKKVYSVTYAQTPIMQMKWANLWKLEQEAMLKAIVDKNSSGAFDQFVSNWTSQGGNEITAEVQKMDVK
jgi:multiple sugar transport system substrate-binding protein/putative aldouronate transport system substrate-binding protein